MAPKRGGHADRFVPRRRVWRALHDRCRRILADSVVAARAELVWAPLCEHAVRVVRLRKLEELETYASALG